MVTVSHHESFVAALATEKWVVKNGTIAETVVLAKSKNDLPEFTAKDAAKGKAAAEAAARA